MSCGAITKQKYTNSTLLEPTEASKFEAVAITFKMVAKNNDCNEHEQKQSPLTGNPLFSTPMFSCFLLPSKIILFLRQYRLRSIRQTSKGVGILCDFYHLESKEMATSHTSPSLYQRNARE